MSGDMTFSLTDSLFMAVGMMGFGMILLIRGGDKTVDAAIDLARRLGVPPMVAGFTIVAFGTSLPELVVSVTANLDNLPGIALGNVLGSNIANILLVLGLTATIATLNAVPKELRGDLTVMLAASVGLAALMTYGHIAAPVGMAMVLSLVLYTVFKYRVASRAGPQKENDETGPQESNFKNSGIAVIVLLASLASITAGAEFLVRGAKIAASGLGMPEEVIGLTVIAVGTSLPELSTCLAAAWKKHNDIVLGNIIGSNFFNILMIIGTTAAIRPIDMGLVAPQMTEFDIRIALAVSFLFALIVFAYRKIDRFVGIMFVGGYAAYLLAVYLLYIR